MAWFFLPTKGDNREVCDWNLKKWDWKSIRATKLSAQSQEMLKMRMTVQLLSKFTLQVCIICQSLHFITGPHLRGLKGEFPGNILNSRRKKAGACGVPLLCLLSERIWKAWGERYHNQKNRLAITLSVLDSAAGCPQESIMLCKLRKAEGQWFLFILHICGAQLEQFDLQNLGTLNHYKSCP